MNPTPEFMEAIRRHRELVDCFGMEHPDTQRAFMLAMELAPDELMNEFGDMAREMGLMPEAAGYLDDGTPMFRLDDVAERLGVSQAEAGRALHEMLNEREALGLSNDGIVTNAARIHLKQ